MFYRRPLCMAFANSMPPRSMTFMVLCRVIRLQLCILCLFMSMVFLAVLHRCVTSRISESPFEFALLSMFIAEFVLT